MSRFWCYYYLFSNTISHKSSNPGSTSFQSWTEFQSTYGCGLSQSGLQSGLGARSHVQYVLVEANPGWIRVGNNKKYQPISSLATNHHIRPPPKLKRHAYLIMCTSAQYTTSRYLNPGDLNTIRQQIPRLSANKANKGKISWTGALDRLQLQRGNIFTRAFTWFSHTPRHQNIAWGLACTNLSIGIHWVLPKVSLLRGSAVYRVYMYSLLDIIISQSNRKTPLKEDNLSTKDKPKVLLYTHSI